MNQQDKTRKEANHMVELSLHNDDCFKVLPTIPDKSVDLILIDPPFGIEADKLTYSNNRDNSKVIEGYREWTIEEYPTFTEKYIAESYRILKDNSSMYIISGWTNLDYILTTIRESRFTLTNHLIWQYNFPLHTKRKWVSSHYHILYLTKVKPTFNRFAESEDTKESYHYRNSVIKIPRTYNTGKIRNHNSLPIALVEKLIKYSSNPGDTVLDCFAGSGTTGEAALSIGRNFIGIEVNQESFKLIQQRLLGKEIEE